MVVVQILLAIFMVLGNCFYYFLIFWKKCKSENLVWQLKVATLSIILISLVGYLILEEINPISVWIKAVIVSMWAMLLILDAIRKIKERKARKKESEEKEDS